MPDHAPDRDVSNTAQLRDAINAGETGDKIAGFDPAASPLGADDEAAGAPPSEAVVRQAYAAEMSGRPASATANAATPELQPDARLPRSGGWMSWALAGIAVALALAVVWYLSMTGGR